MITRCARGHSSSSFLACCCVALVGVVWSLGKRSKIELHSSRVENGMFSLRLVWIPASKRPRFDRRKRVDRDSVEMRARRAFRVAQLPREPVRNEIASFELVEEFSLEESWFRSNLRKARWRAASGPSSMNADHLRPMVENSADSPVHSQVALLLCKAKAADETLSVMVKAESLRRRSPTEESEVLREKPVGPAYSFGISEERIARRRTVVRMPPRFTSSVRRRGLSKSTESSIVEARPQLTPRGEDESVEQGVAWSLKIVTFFTQELSCGEETEGCRLPNNGSRSSAFCSAFQIFSAAS